MFSIVLDIELADENVIKELGVFLMAKFKDTRFVLQRITNPQNKRFGAKKLGQNCVEQWKFGLQWAFKHST